MKNSLGRKSTAYICYLFVNFFWYASFILAGLLVLAFLGTLTGVLPTDVTFRIPVDPSIVEFVSLDQSSDIINLADISSVDASLSYNYLLQHHTEIYIGWIFFALIDIGLMLFGLFQLRTLLKTTVNEAVFSMENIRRIKIIAILIILIEPLQWIEYYFFLKPIGPIVAQNNIEVTLGYLLGGLLIFVLAAVFEKGYKMYRELELTV